MIVHRLLKLQFLQSLREYYPPQIKALDAEGMRFRFQQSIQDYEQERSKTERWK
jgi:hypothetical protein